METKFDTQLERWNDILFDLAYDNEPEEVEEDDPEGRAISIHEAKETHD